MMKTNNENKNKGSKKFTRLLSQSLAMLTLISQGAMAAGPTPATTKTQPVVGSPTDPKTDKVGGVKGVFDKAKDFAKKNPIAAAAIGAGAVAIVGTAVGLPLFFAFRGEKLPENIEELKKEFENLAEKISKYRKGEDYTFSDENDSKIKELADEMHKLTEKTILVSGGETGIVNLGLAKKHEDVLCHFQRKYPISQGISQESQQENSEFMRLMEKNKPGYNKEKALSDSNVLFNGTTLGTVSVEGKSLSTQTLKENVKKIKDDSKKSENSSSQPSAPTGDVNSKPSNQPNPSGPTPTTRTTNDPSQSQGGDPTENKITIEEAIKLDQNVWAISVNNFEHKVSCENLVILAKIMGFDKNKIDKNGAIEKAKGVIVAELLTLSNDKTAIDKADNQKKALQILGKEILKSDFFTSEYANIKANRKDLNDVNNAEFLSKTLGQLNSKKEIFGNAQTADSFDLVIEALFPKKQENNQQTKKKVIEDFTLTEISNASTRTGFKTADIDGVGPYIELLKEKNVEKLLNSNEMKEILGGFDGNTKVVEFVNKLKADVDTSNINSEECTAIEFIKLSYKNSKEIATKSSGADTNSWNHEKTDDRKLGLLGAIDFVVNNLNKNINFNTGEVAIGKGSGDQNVKKPIGGLKLSEISSSFIGSSFDGFDDLKDWEKALLDKKLDFTNKFNVLKECIGLEKEISNTTVSEIFEKFSSIKTDFKIPESKTDRLNASDFIKSKIKNLALNNVDNFITSLGKVDNNTSEKFNLTSGEIFVESNPNMILFKSLLLANLDGNFIEDKNQKFGDLSKEMKTLLNVKENVDVLKEDSVFALVKTCLGLDQSKSINDTSAGEFSNAVTSLNFNVLDDLTNLSREDFIKVKFKKINDDDGVDRLVKALKLATTTGNENKKFNAGGPNDIVVDENVVKGIKHDANKEIVYTINDVEKRFTATGAQFHELLELAGSDLKDKISANSETSEKDYNEVVTRLDTLSSKPLENVPASGDTSSVRKGNIKLEIVKEFVNNPTDKQIDRVIDEAKEVNNYIGKAGGAAEYRKAIKVIHGTGADASAIVEFDNGVVLKQSTCELIINKLNNASPPAASPPAASPPAASPPAASPPADKIFKKGIYNVEDFKEEFLELINNIGGDVSTFKDGKPTDAKTMYLQVLKMYLEKKGLSESFDKTITENDLKDILDSLSFSGGASLKDLVNASRKIKPWNVLIGSSVSITTDDVYPEWTKEFVIDLGDGVKFDLSKLNKIRNLIIPKNDMSNEITKIDFIKKVKYALGLNQDTSSEESLTELLNKNDNTPIGREEFIKILFRSVKKDVSILENVLETIGKISYTETENASFRKNFLLRCEALGIFTEKNYVKRLAKNKILSDDKGPNFNVIHLKSVMNLFLENDGKNVVFEKDSSPEKFCSEKLGINFDSIVDTNSKYNVTFSSSGDDITNNKDAILSILEFCKDKYNDAANVEVLNKVFEIVAQDITVTNEFLKGPKSKLVEKFKKRSSYDRAAFAEINSKFGSDEAVKAFVLFGTEFDNKSPFEVRKILEGELCSEQNSITSLEALKHLLALIEEGAISDTAEILNALKKFNAITNANNLLVKNDGTAMDDITSDKLEVDSLKAVIDINVPVTSRTVSDDSLIQNDENVNDDLKIGGVAFKNNIFKSWFVQNGMFEDLIDKKYSSVTEIFDGSSDGGKGIKKFVGEKTASLTNHDSIKNKKDLSYAFLDMIFKQDLEINISDVEMLNIFNGNNVSGNPIADLSTGFAKDKILEKVGLAPQNKAKKIIIDDSNSKIDDTGFIGKILAKANKTKEKLEKSIVKSTDNVITKELYEGIISEFRTNDVTSEINDFTTNVSPEKILVEFVKRNPDANLTEIKKLTDVFGNNSYADSTYNNLMDSVFTDNSQKVVDTKDAFSAAAEKKLGIKKEEFVKVFDSIGDAKNFIDNSEKVSEKQAEKKLNDLAQAIKNKINYLKTNNEYVKFYSFSIIDAAFEGKLSKEACKALDAYSSKIGSMSNANDSAPKVVMEKIGDKLKAVHLKEGFFNDLFDNYDGATEAVKLFASDDTLGDVVLDSSILSFEKLLDKIFDGINGNDDTTSTNLAEKVKIQAFRSLQKKEIIFDDVKKVLSSTVTGTVSPKSTVDEAIKIEVSALDENTDFGDLVVSSGNLKLLGLKGNIAKLILTDVAKSESHYPSIKAVLEKITNVVGNETTSDITDDTNKEHVFENILDFCTKNKISKLECEKIKSVYDSLNIASNTAIKTTIENNFKLSLDELTSLYGDDAKVKFGNKDYKISDAKDCFLNLGISNKKFFSCEKVTEELSAASFPSKLKLNTEENYKKLVSFALLSNAITLDEYEIYCNNYVTNFNEIEFSKNGFDNSIKEISGFSTGKVEVSDETPNEFDEVYVKKVFGSDCLNFEKILKLIFELRRMPNATIDASGPSITDGDSKVKAAIILLLWAFKGDGALSSGSNHFGIERGSKLLTNFKNADTIKSYVDGAEIEGGN